MCSIEAGFSCAARPDAEADVCTCQLSTAECCVRQYGKCMGSSAESCAAEGDAAAAAAALERLLFVDPPSTEPGSPAEAQRRERRMQRAQLEALHGELRTAGDGALKF